MAKNWLDPAEIQRDQRILAAFSLVLCGVVTWEVLSKFWFDYSILLGRRKFKWPMILYFICRLCMILHIYSFAIQINAISEIPCMPVIWISKVTDAIGTTSSSLILALRTFAVWHQDKRVGVPLGLVFLGQVVLWIQTFRYSESFWNPQRNQCVVAKTAPRSLLVAVFSYTMAYDFIILVLCTIRLHSASRRNGHGLSSLLLRDGIGYFCAAFSANLIQTVLAALHLNPVMNLMFLSFALVVSALAATTVFRNVFALHDAWAGDSGASSSSGGSGARAPNRSAAMPVFRRTTRGGESSGGAFSTDVHALDDLDGRTVAGSKGDPVKFGEADSHAELGAIKQWYS